MFNKTEKLFYVYPGRLGRVNVVLWERYKQENNCFKEINPFGDGTVSRYVYDIRTDRENYVADVDLAKKALLARAGFKKEEVKYFKTENLDFEREDMVYSDWEN